MLGHADGIVSVGGSTGDVTVGLWTIDVEGGDSYDLDFGNELSTVPGVLRVGLGLEDGALQSKVNCARVFLLLSHFSAVVSFFSFLWFLLDILHGTKGQLTLFSINSAHVVVLVISCGCMSSAYKGMEGVDKYEWSGSVVWLGFSLALLSLLMSGVVIAIDKLLLNRYDATQHTQQHQSAGEVANETAPQEPAA